MSGHERGSCKAHGQYGRGDEPARLRGQDDPFDQSRHCQRSVGRQQGEDPSCLDEAGRAFEPGSRLPGKKEGTRRQRRKCHEAEGGCHRHDPPVAIVEILRPEAALIAGKRLPAGQCAGRESRGFGADRFAIGTRRQCFCRNHPPLPIMLPDEGGKVPAFVQSSYGVEHRAFAARVEHLATMAQRPERIAPQGEAHIADRQVVHDARAQLQLARALLAQIVDPAPEDRRQADARGGKQGQLDHAGEFAVPVDQLEREGVDRGFRALQEIGPEVGVVRMLELSRGGEHRVENTPFRHGIARLQQA